MKLPFTLTNDSLTVFVKCVPSTVLAGTVRYRTLRDAILQEQWDQIPSLLTTAGALAQYLGGDFAVSCGNAAPQGTIVYKGVALPEALNERITEMANSGADVAPLLLFYERLHKNPSFRSREQLFQFMKHLDISIEADGTFLAYKGIREDMTDCHSGTINNSPGNVIQMDRNLVSDDSNEACHAGLHAGSIKYAAGFARGEVVIVRVDPEHVVSIPQDHDEQKMRVCRYEVVGIWNGINMGVNADSQDLPEDYLEYTDDDSEYKLATQPAQINVAIRKNLKPGTVFHYTGTAPDGVSYVESMIYRVDNLVLPGSPETTHTESFPNLDARVVVLWTPPEPVAQAAAPLVLTPLPSPHKLDGLNTRELMQEPIEDLRKYASNRLKIHGASKIPGGKATLVAKIMKVRRRMK